MRTTGCAFAWPSASAKSRPRVGCSRNMRNVLGVIIAPETRSGARSFSLMLAAMPRKAASSLNVFVRLFHSSYSGHEAGNSACVCVLRKSTCRSWCESSNGRPRINTAFTKVKTVVFMPIPSASARMATAVNPGSFRRSRAANRRSCQNAMGAYTKLIVDAFLR